VEVILKL
jgi:hypothetical protein